MKRKFTLRMILMMAFMVLGMGSAYGQLRVGTTTFDTGYLGQKSDMYEISDDGTWTFTFKCYNAGQAQVWNGFILGCSDGSSDKFLLRSDNYELIAGNGTNCTDTWTNQGTSYADDLNGATVVMNVTRNDGVISVSALITPVDASHQFTKEYTYSGATGNLYLYFSVDNSYVDLKSAKWQAEGSSVREVQIYISESYNITGKNTGLQDATKLFIHSQGGNYGEAQMKFLLDEDWNASKVTNAYLGLYTISKASGRENDPVNLFKISGFNANLSNKTATLDSEHSTSEAKIYSYGSNNTRSYGFDGGEQLSSKTLSNFTAGNNTNYDITEYVKTLTSLEAGAAVYFGIQAGDAKPTDLYLGGCGNLHAVKLVITYDDAIYYDYTVNAKDGDGNILKEIASGSYLAGDNAITVAYPQYILSGTTLYNIKNNTGSGEDWYRVSFTPNKDNFEQVLNYTNGTVENVVCYMEAEDIPGFSAADNNARASNGKIARSGGNFKTLTTLSPGMYKIYARGISNNATRTVTVKVGESEVWNWTIGSGTNQLGNSDEFVVGTTSTVTIACVGSSTDGLDWVYVLKTGNVVSQSISNVGWATLYTPYALSFAGTGLTAYTATVANGQVTLAEVSDVPANTGVVLQGEAGSYLISSIASSTTAQGELQGSATEALAYDENAENDYYMLAYNSETDKVQFTKLTSGSIAAGKAYLVQAKNSTSGARTLNVVFAEGGTTGIQTLDKTQQADGACYNLNGQRVSQPAKGLYIVNGKKVVIK